MADVGVSFNRLDHFSVTAVAKKFEDLCKYRMAFVLSASPVRRAYMT